MTTATASVPSNSGISGDRIFNLSAGPATLPEEVIHQAQQDLWNIFDTGIGIMEHSHRGKAFGRVLEEAVADCREVGNISDDYEVMFLQGGATLQFAMIPMNFLPDGATADYLVTGVWSKKALNEASKLGNAHVAFDGEASQFDHVPTEQEIRYSESPAYVHYCSNNTIYGTRYTSPPSTDAPVIADMSSDMFSGPIDVNAHAMIYAGAQKNLGPSGVVLVIIRKDFLITAKKGLPAMLDYAGIAAKNSCLNTPPTFGIYFMGQVFKWILRNGGLSAMAERNRRKAGWIYQAVDDNSGFYTSVARPECRSLMNITFRCPTEELDAKFVAEAKDLRMDGVKGYRTVGGIRASVYNAFPEEGCRILSQFMKDFAQRNG